jgi:two-component system, NarL family, nitrate/nitrite response regulator NarL
MSSQFDPNLSKSTKKVRVVISERDRMSGQVLAESLERDSRFQVVAISAKEELVAVTKLRKPDVVVISADFVSGAKKGLQVAHALSMRFAAVRLVLLLDSLTRESVLASFRSGARGVFCRSEPVSEFRACVGQVNRGEIWVKGAAAEYLVEAVRSSPSCEAIDLETLSKREVEVVQHVVHGETNKQIADALRLSEHTVKNYLFRIFEKLGVSNRMELLFLLSTQGRDAVLGPSAINLQGSANSLKGYLRAAQEGSVSAQFIVGSAYFGGRGTEKNEKAAYYWLRMAEENSAELGEHIRALTGEVKAKMALHEIEELEKSLTADKEKMLLGKKLTQLPDEDEDVALPA